MSDHKAFYPKILLFGEYSVILGSQALTMPYHEYQGMLKLANHGKEYDSSEELKVFFKYLKSSNQFHQYNPHFDWPKFQFELNRGLYFESNIPQGYGVGSSGAVTASIFDRYMDSDFVKELSLVDLRKCLGIMESHFHGKSSGLDPLVSYLNKPVLVCQNEIKNCQLPESNKGDYALFLLDTGRSRRTEALVNLFIEKLKNPIFAKACEDDLIPMTHQCIQSFLKMDKDNLYQSFYQLSQFQFEHLSPMIPKVYTEKWEQGLKEKNTILKLCGAGGGGYLLGLTKSLSSLANEWGNEKIKVLWRL